MKIIVFGDLPIATLVAKHILEHRKVELAGVVIGNENPTNNDPWDVPLLAEFASNEGIMQYTLEGLVEEFGANELFIGFSCRFSKILKRRHLNLFRRGIVNFHGGLLPEFGGLYSSCHTILEGAEIGGGTIHYIDENIDKGKIITRAEFNVKDTDTSFTLFQRTQEALYKAFLENFDCIINNSAKTFDNDYFNQLGIEGNYFDKQSLDEKKVFSISDELGKIDRIVRAFDFPGKEPAFFKIAGKKYFVRMDY